MNTSALTVFFISLSQMYPSVASRHPLYSREGTFYLSHNVHKGTNFYVLMFFCLKMLAITQRGKLAHLDMSSLSNNDFAY